MTTELKPPELKPCPFCGGEAELSSRNCLAFFATCQKPYCCVVGPARCEADARDDWNRRTASEADVERVARIIDPAAWEIHKDLDEYWDGRRSIARGKARAAIAAMEG